MILLTGGVANPNQAKTAINLIRYKPHEVVAVLDPAAAGQTAQNVFGLGGGLPIVGSFDAAPKADTVVVGIAPAGGKLPAEMRRHVLEAIGRGMTVVSGLHEFLSHDPEIARAAAASGAQVNDVRLNREKEVAHRKGIDNRCLRIHTVGHDCNVGKMVVSLEVSQALQKAGHDSKFVATGQTGIMIEGDGCPIDAVVADFINGAAERLVLANQNHAILLIEGQGCITHPRYSAVTLGLLHGCLPDGLIFCYEMGRELVAGMEPIRIPPLKVLRGLYEDMANAAHPCEFIGIAVNGRRFKDAEVAAECARVEQELGLPACDVLRHGPKRLVEAVLGLKARLKK